MVCASVIPLANKAALTIYSVIKDESVKVLLKCRSLEIESLKLLESAKSLVISATL